MAFPEIDEIHLLLVAEEAIDDELLAQYWSLLSPDEIARHDRIRTRADQRQFLITRAAVRTALSDCVPGVLPADWQFSRSAHGRPAIAGPVCDTGIVFNISHARGLIVIAIAREGELGVDVESIDRAVDATALARRYFAPEEANAMFSLAEDQRRARFFDLWTLKEAWVKATGEGLARALRHAGFAFSKNRIEVKFTEASKESSKRWQFWQLRPSRQHQIAIAFAAANSPCGSGSRPRAPMNLSVTDMVPMRSLIPRDLSPFRKS